MVLMELTLPHTNLSTSENAGTTVELQLSSNAGSSSVVVSPLHTAIVQAHYQDKTQIKDIPNEELLFFCGKVISNALAKLNHKNTYDDEGRAVAITILAQDLRLHRPFYTKQEIVMAVGMGCNGEFSKPDAIITFSPSMVMRWTAAYGEKRNEALKIERQEQKKKAKILHQQQMEMAGKQYLSEQWARLLDYVQKFGEFPTEPKTTIDSLFLDFYAKLTESGYHLPALIKWDILLDFRKRVADKVPELERIMFRNDLGRFIANIDNTQTNLCNNFFGSKAMRLAKIKCFQLLFWQMLQRTPFLLRKIEF